MSLTIVAWLVVLGALGSFHCAAMCGAFAAAAGRRGLGFTLAYTAGRLTAYAALGAIAGAVGMALHASAGRIPYVATILSIAAGVALAAMGLRSVWPAGGQAIPAGVVGRIYLRALPLVRACLDPPSRDQAYALGVVNGLLPCPITTPVLLAALASGSAMAGAALLVALGLGTVPAMIAAAKLGATASVLLGRTPQLRQRAVGVGLLALGVLTAARPLLAGGGHTHLG